MRYSRYMRVVPGHLGSCQVTWSKLTSAVLPSAHHKSLSPAAKQCTAPTVTSDRRLLYATYVVVVVCLLSCSLFNCADFRHRQGQAAGSRQGGLSDSTASGRPYLRTLRLPDPRPTAFHFSPPSCFCLAIPLPKASDILRELLF